MEGMAEEVRHATPGKPMNAMSAELAIQRELAYRKRVAALFKHYDESTEGLMPLKLDSSSQNPLPRTKMPQPNEPEPSFIPSPHSHPKSSPAKSSSLTPPRQLPHSALNTTPTPQCQRSSLHQSPTLLGSKRRAPSSRTESQSHAQAGHQCYSTNVSLTPPFLSKAPSGHIECQPHAQAGDQHYSTNVALQNEKQKSFFCKICQVPCSGDFNMKQHLDGQKHKAKMLLAKHGHGGRQDERWSCQVCNTWCTSEDSFKMHLRGRRHLCSLYDREQRVRDADAALRMLD